MGIIYSYDMTHGYGFVRLEDKSKVFFHISDCLIPEKELKIGAKVVFAIKEYQVKGVSSLKAINVQYAE